LFFRAEQIHIGQVICQHFSKIEVRTNQAQDVALMTVKVPCDVRKKLEEWAAFNVSSMTAELIRSARERAEREQLEKAER
jgi:hypothetical protein